MKKDPPIISALRRSFKYDDYMIDRSTGLPNTQLDLFNDVLNSNRQTFFNNYVKSKKKADRSA